MKYRSDIDGLRAIAVLPVLLFHAGNPLFSGGYAGVDIFFVLSGFLITSLILPDIATGTFSLTQFYERRIRRILPLLFFVISAALLAAFKIITPGQLDEYARSALAALFSVSNIFFWKQDSYFAENATLKPLLHTWSLGVEEQYYIVFPLFLMLLWRFRKSDHLLKIVAGITLYSFFLANWGGVFDSDIRESVTHLPVTLTPDYGYYLLTTRAWELLCGSLAAILLWQHAKRITKISDRTAYILSWIGLGVILASYFLLDKTTPYPSLYTVPAVLGTVSIILFCRSDNVLYKMLSLRPLVFTGLISYSLYLWHQPVFAFLRHLFPDIHTIVFYIAIGGVYVLSVASWAFIEKPFRNRTTMPTARLYKIMGAWFIALIILIGATIYHKGFIAAYPPFERQFYMNKNERGQYVEKRFDALRNASFPDNIRHNLLIIGDSHAQDFTNILFESSQNAKWNISTLQMKARCQIYIGPDDIFPFINTEDHPLCREQRIKFFQDFSERASQADRIILAASWKLWAAERLVTTLEAIQKAAPQAEIIVIGQKYFGTLTYQDYLRKLAQDSAPITLPINAENIAINTTLKMKAKGQQFIDLYDLFCNRGTACPLLSPEGHVISYDGGHLTQDGATYIGRVLKDTGLLN